MCTIEESMCRVCLQAYHDDYESVFDIDSKNLSEVGSLYVELISLPILLKMGHPRYLCNYCILQLKLFHKFKTKAVESHTLFNSILAEQQFKEEESKKVEISNTVYNEEAMNIKTEVTENEKDSEYEYFEINDADDLGEDQEEKEADMGEEEEETEMVDEEVNEFEDIQYLDDDIDDGSNMDDTQDTEEDDESTKRLRLHTGVYPCNTCNLEFGKKTELIKHRRQKHKRERYACTQCPKKFFSESQLQVHLNVHWGLPAYQCDICGKGFKQKVHHVNHMNNHFNKRDVQCHLCGKGFLTKSDLKIHLRMHTGERRYACDICGKRFRAHTHMKNHRYTHLGKTFQCEYCQRLYTTPATLKIHVQCVHQNLCPFPCTVCNKRFKRKHHLMAHMKTHSPKHDSTIELLES